MIPSMFSCVYYMNIVKKFPQPIFIKYVRNNACVCWCEQFFIYVECFLIINKLVSKGNGLYV